MASVKWHLGPLADENRFDGTRMSGEGGYDRTGIENIQIYCYWEGWMNSLRNMKKFEMELMIDFRETNAFIVEDHFPV